MNTASEHLVGWLLSCVLGRLLWFPVNLYSRQRGYFKLSRRYSVHEAFSCHHLQYRFEWLSFEVESTVCFASQSNSTHLHRQSKMNIRLWPTVSKSVTKWLVNVWTVFEKQSTESKTQVHKCQGHDSAHSWLLDRIFSSVHNTSGIWDTFSAGSCCMLIVEVWRCNWTSKQTVWNKDNSYMS